MRKLFTTLFLCAVATLGFAQNDITTVTVTTPGTLSTLLPTGDDLLKLTRLKVSGSINTDDIGIIRQAAGGGIDGYKTDGRLEYLDLSDAKIVKGGDHYYTDPGSGETEKVLFDNTIGYNMFYECSSLETVILPEGITRLYDQAFSLCSNLKEINIPSTVKRMGETFFYCTKLTHIDLPEGLTEIGDYCFDHCENLTEITIPSTVTNIGDIAFGDTGLKTVVFPEGVTSVGTSCFMDCDDLRTVVLPSTITSIGDNAFIRDSLLTDIWCYAQNPPTLKGSDAFFKVPTTTKLHVPAGYGELYKTLGHYDNYLTIEEFDATTTTPEAILATGIRPITKSNAAMEVYDLSGNKKAGLTKGVNIIRKDGKVKKVLVR